MNLTRSRLNLNPTSRTPMNLIRNLNLNPMSRTPMNLIRNLNLNPMSQILMNRSLLTNLIRDPLNRTRNRLNPNPMSRTRMSPSQMNPIRTQWTRLLHSQDLPNKPLEKRKRGL